MQDDTCIRIGFYQVCTQIFWVAVHFIVPPSFGGGEVPAVCSGISCTPVGFVDMVDEQSAAADVFIPALLRPAFKQEIFSLGIRFHFVIFAADVYRLQGMDAG